MEKKYIVIFLVLILFFACNREVENSTPPQPIAVNANSNPNVYEGYFLYGSNMGWKNDNWKDEDVADILAGNSSKNIVGAGVNSLRPALYESFVETWGYNVRASAFQHYHNIGARNNVVFIADRPSDAHRERKQYTSAGASQSYENLYEPIWDDGENGTPVNDKNYYALYVYKVVSQYKGQVKFWEVKNEPDFCPRWDYPGGLPGSSGNWWENDPQPENLTNWFAPIQSYIRLLRVSYEVIKSVDPDAFICVGGIGYLSFLDAILRNTDNPDAGKVTEMYPYKGGAWFDCLSFHCYPMYYLRSWNNNTGRFDTFRNSDAAVNAVMNARNEYEDLLKKYGYGGEYPAKEMIITETNVPGKQVGDYIGSTEAQRNYVIKTAIAGQKNRISGIYIYGPWDNVEQSNSGGEYDFMGLYKPLPNAPGGTLRINDSGIGWRTTSRKLHERKYDAAETSKLSLPTGIEGAAFYSTKSKNYVYVLWAKISGDLSETASANYTFPASFGVSRLTVTTWNEQQSTINSNTIALTGSPVFVEL